MTDDSAPDEGRGARMELDADTLHAGENGYYLDCPACGSPAPLIRIVEYGRCSGFLDADVTEVEDDDEPTQEPACTAELSLELVWQS